jgi:hypothetical protein
LTDFLLTELIIDPDRPDQEKTGRNSAKNNAYAIKLAVK